MGLRAKAMFGREHQRKEGVVGPFEGEAAVVAAELLEPARGGPDRAQILLQDGGVDPHGTGILAGNRR
jgi:hypothetical protein